MPFKTGNIPQNLTFFRQSAQVITTGWDDMDDVNIAQVSVYPAYVSDADNATTLKTGEHWAKGYPSKGGQKPFTSPNDPMFGLRIVGLEKRAEGGRAWKVILPDNSYVDLREDVLLDAIVTVGVGEHGVMNGAYIFAKIGSQMKVIRVGSALHNVMIESAKAKEQKPLKGFQVGHVYKAVNGSRMYFMGEAWSIKPDKTTVKIFVWLEVPEWVKDDGPALRKFLTDETRQRNGGSDYGNEIYLRLMLSQPKMVQDLGEYKITPLAAGWLDKERADYRRDLNNPSRRYFSHSERQDARAILFANAFWNKADLQPKVRD